MLTLRGRGFGVCWLWAYLLVGCGGESDGNDGQAQCSAQACGGDVVGTWDIESMCLTLAEPPVPNDAPECRNLLRNIRVAADGTITFTADGMATLNLTTTLSLDVLLTDACARVLGGGNVTSAMCDALEAEYTSNPEFSSARCSFTPGVCSCTVTGLPSTSSQTDPYSIDGNQLVIGADPADYCVDGDRLSLGVTLTNGSYNIVARRSP